VRQVTTFDMRSPVLFLVFNRPDTTAQVFEAIRRAQPPRLYVAADGPRPVKAGEQERCDTVRRIATAVDWPCELVTLLREQNLGCKRAVSSAVSWFFEHEAEGIVLEDDCVPDPTFFAYCDELLERYRDDPRVMCISGDNFISSAWTPRESYYFSRYVHIWGWATWRRAWAFYDVDMKEWRDADNAGVVKRRLPGESRAAAHWREIFDLVSSGQIDTWDYQWTFACWRHGGLSCMPATNLISNIGFGEGATHTVSPESKLANLAAIPLGMPFRHPAEVEAQLDADRWTSEHVFGIDERQGRMAALSSDIRRSLQRAKSRRLR
jgi:hypothetical protein